MSSNTGSGYKNDFSSHKIVKSLFSKVQKFKRKEARDGPLKSTDKFELDRNIFVSAN